MSKVMKPSARKSAFHCFCITLLSFVTALTSCSEKELMCNSSAGRQQFVSAEYNHFEGGVLFNDVAFGLDVLWEASFQYGRTYKENLGFFVAEGLLVCPNKNNTFDHASMNAFRLKVVEGKLFVNVDNKDLQVLGIIHTHPDAFCLRMPAPRNDYQFGFLGIHNYVMGHLDLFDAHKDRGGNEVYERLGSRTAYEKIPYCRVKQPVEIAVATLSVNGK
jgi:hypothetical protein